MAVRLLRQYCWRTQTSKFSPNLARTALCRHCSQNSNDDSEREPKGFATPKGASKEQIKRYERFGVRIVKDDGLHGTTRKEGVTGDVMPAVEEYKSPFRLMNMQIERGFTGRAEDVTDPLLIPRETDIAIIGGGVMGSAVAYWLKQRNPNGFKLHVIERDHNVRFRIIFNIIQ